MGSGSSKQFQMDGEVYENAKVSRIDKGIRVKDGATKEVIYEGPFKQDGDVYLPHGKMQKYIRPSDYLWVFGEYIAGEIRVHYKNGKKVSSCLYASYYNRALEKRLSIEYEGDFGYFNYAKPKLDGKFDVYVEIQGELVKVYSGIFKDNKCEGPGRAICGPLALRGCFRQHAGWMVCSGAVLTCDKKTIAEWDQVKVKIPPQVDGMVIKVDKIGYVYRPGGELIFEGRIPNDYFVPKHFISGKMYDDDMVLEGSFRKGVLYNGHIWQGDRAIVQVVQGVQHIISDARDPAPSYERAPPPRYSDLRPSGAHEVSSSSSS